MSDFFLSAELSFMRANPPSAAACWAGFFPSHAKGAAASGSAVAHACGLVAAHALLRESVAPSSLEYKTVSHVLSESSLLHAVDKLLWGHWWIHAVFQVCQGCTKTVLLLQAASGLCAVLNMGAELHQHCQKCFCKPLMIASVRSFWCSIHPFT